MALPTHANKREVNTAALSLSTSLLHPNGSCHVQHTHRAHDRRSQSTVRRHLLFVQTYRVLGGMLYVWPAPEPMDTLRLRKYTTVADYRATNVPDTPHPHTATKGH